MNCSLDKSPPGAASSLNFKVNFFFNGGICEQKHDLKMPTKEAIKGNNLPFPLRTSSSASSFISSLYSNPHCKTLNSVIPQKTLRDIPSFNNRSLNSLFDKHLANMGHLGDAITINTKLKDILMPFVPSHSLTNVLNFEFEKCQCLIPDREEIKTSHQEHLCPTDDFSTHEKAPSEDLLEPIDDSSELMEVDEGDHNIIFDHNISMELSSCDDNEADEGDRDDDDDCFIDDDDDESSDSDDYDDIDFSDWDEAGDSCTKELNETRSSFTLDNVMLKWDPGIDEELKNLPKSSQVSFKSWLDSSDDDDDDDNPLLLEANQKWNKFYCSHSKRKGKTRIISKKVSFALDDKLQTIHQWEDCEGNRSGPWHHYALDRARFKRRIEECEGKLSKVLQPQHRIKMSLMLANCKYTDDKLD